MKEIILPIAPYLNMHQFLSLVQPEPEDMDSRLEAQHCHGYSGCGNYRYKEQQD